MSLALVFDTETTGLIGNSAMNEKHQPRIIEFYGCLVDEEDNIAEELEFLCHPGIKLEKIITRITGLTDDDLKGQPAFPEYAERLIQFIEKATMVVAHNLSYDFDMVTNELKRCDMKVKWPWQRLCTVEQTEWFKGYRLSLGALYEHLFNEEFEGAHRARNDVAALTKCFCELRRRGDI